MRLRTPLCDLLGIDHPIVHDLPGAAEVVAAIVREAEAVLDRLSARRVTP